MNEGVPQEASPIGVLEHTEDLGFKASHFAALHRLKQSHVVSAAVMALVLGFIVQPLSHQFVPLGSGLPLTRTQVTTTSMPSKPVLSSIESATVAHVAGSGIV